MGSGISFNGSLMVWVVIDENPQTGELEMYPSADPSQGDWLIPIEEVTFS